MIERIRTWNLIRAGIKKFSEAIVSPFRKLDPDEANWTSISSQTNRDLSAFDQRYTSDIAYYKWLTDPLAARVIEIIADFVIGEGIKLKSEDEKVQQILDEFWYDEINNFPQEQISMVQELQIFGEQVILPFVNPIDGLVQLSRLDPTWIEKVKPMDKFKQKPDYVCLRKSNIIDSTGQSISELKVMRTQIDPKDPMSGYMVGDCFYFSLNKIAGKTRGHSQLLRTHEWIDIYGNRIFNEAERQELANNYVWDVTLKGASDQQIRDFVAANPRPQPASVRAHSDAVEWNVLTPDLKSADFSESNRQFLQLILGAYGLPEHYFALGGDVNYATAKAMSEPTMRMFKRLQRSFQSNIETLCDYQIQQAYLKRRLPASEAEYEVIMDEVSSIDLAAISAAVVNLVGALQTAEGQAWINQEGAAEAFVNLMSQANVKVESAGENEPPKQLKDVANAFSMALEQRKKKKGLSY